MVTKGGKIIYPDRQLMLFAADVLSRNPGATIIYDVKCTRHLAPWIERPRRQAAHVEDRPFADQGQDEGNRRALAGEMSGHIFFKERWYGFDDGIYAGARLLEILSRDADRVGSAASAARLPYRRPSSMSPAPEASHRTRLIDKLAARPHFPAPSDVIRIDGLRVEYAMASAWPAPPIRRRSSCCASRPTTTRRWSAFKAEFRRVLTESMPGRALPF